MYLIGQGSDNHELVEIKDYKMKLGGYSFDSGWRIISHSDGDIILHSIANAVLGALQLGDIGEYFSDTNPKTKNVDSKKIVEFAMKKLKASKFSLVNVDMTVVCENIILGKIKKQICKSLQKILGIKYVNVKATRYEHPSNFIACHSVVLINK